jgi:hypothetical protein
MINKESISNIVYSFGNPHGGKFGSLILETNGDVLGYTHNNEYTWLYDEEHKSVCFLDKKKNITSRLYFNEQIQAWFGHTEKGLTPLYLYPLYSSNIISNKALPPIVLNGTPYNGAAFLQKAFARCGWNNSNITLNCKDTVIITEGEYTQKLQCPVELLPPVLKGCTLLANIDAAEKIKLIRQKKIPVFTVIRDIRDSMLEFFEIEAAKKEFKHLSGKKLTEDLVLAHGGGMLLHMRAVLRALVNDRPKIILYYNNNKTGIITDEVAKIIDSYQENTSNMLKDVLPEEYEKFYATRKTRKLEWCEHFEEYYRASGLAALNHIFGYLD